MRRGRRRTGRADRGRARLAGSFASPPVLRDRRTRRNVVSAPSAILRVSASSVVTLRRGSRTAIRRGRRRTFAADRGRARFAAAPKVMPIAPCGSARRPDPARNREYVRPNIESQVSERAPRTGRWRARVSRDRRTRRNVGSAPSAILCVSASSVVTLRRQSWTRRGRRRTGPADRGRARFAGS